VIRRRVTQSATEVSKGLQFVTRVYGRVEKLPQAVGAQIYAFDFVGQPNAKGSPTAGSSMSITAEDAPSADGFVQLIVLIVTAQEAMFDEGSGHLAMWTGSDFKLGQQVVDFLLGRTDPATHDWELPTQRQLMTG